MGIKCTLSLTTFCITEQNWSTAQELLHLVHLSLQCHNWDAVHFGQSACRRYFNGRFCTTHTKPLSGNASGQVTTVRTDSKAVACLKRCYNILFPLNHSVAGWHNVVTFATIPETGIGFKVTWNLRASAWKTLAKVNKLVRTQHTTYIM